MLNDGQRKVLLRIGRDSIVAVLDGIFLELRAESFDQDLCRPAGVFVTLKTRGGNLRGCIGCIQAVDPLFKAVSSSAVSAAFRDPRFQPVGRHELPDLELEISVMSPIERVARLEDIFVGRDGLIISRGRFAGLLLPQVATEYGWDLDTFLEHTCRKAGLPPGSWRSPDTRIERFSAEVFCE